MTVLILSGQRDCHERPRSGNERNNRRAHNTKQFDVLLGGGERPRIYMTRSYDAGDANFENNLRNVD